MELKLAVAALSALAHETRLGLFRALVHAGDEGLVPGAIAAMLDVAPSTLSHHLAQLEHAGIILSRRKSRHIHYVVAIPQVRSLLSFLLDDCCAGRPDLCGLDKRC